MTQQIGDLVKELTSDDIRVDSDGRIVIAVPSISDKIKEAIKLLPDELARDGTNIICCGNGTCGKPEDIGKDLGSLVERFTQGRIK